MKDYGPKPNIEHHHHIQELIDRQSRRADERTYYREKGKATEERESLIRDAKPRELVDFHCKHCRVDFGGLAQKQVEMDWSSPMQRIAFYKMKHECGRWCIRYITDKWADPFWWLSTQVIKDRSKYHNDLLQPGEDGFYLLYGKPK